MPSVASSHSSPASSRTSNHVVVGKVQNCSAFNQAVSNCNKMVLLETFFGFDLHIATYLAAIVDAIVSIILLLTTTVALCSWNHELTEWISLQWKLDSENAWLLDRFVLCEYHCYRSAHNHSNLINCRSFRSICSFIAYYRCCVCAEYYRMRIYVFWCCQSE